MSCSVLAIHKSGIQQSASGFAPQCVSSLALLLLCLLLLIRPQGRYMLKCHSAQRHFAGCRCSCWTANHHKPSLCQAQFASQHLGTTYGDIVQNAPMAALVHDGDAGHKDPCAGQRQQDVVITPGVEVMHMWHQRYQVSRLDGNL